jgi:hypothetical protein
MANILNMADDDYNRYLNNKKVYGISDPNSEAALSASRQNEALRGKYGITGDAYSYNDLYSYGGNKYTGAADQSMAALGNYSRYKDPYNTGNLRRKLDDFNYNPENDAVFQSYKDMYTRQGQAAQGQTLANLTALSGGRNNSWASAAAAQVGQAYSQKIADVVPQLAQQAYDKLLQRYNIEAQESDRAYGRWVDAYGRTRDMADLYGTREQQEMQNRRQNLMDNEYYWEQGLKRQYLPDEYKRNAEKGELELKQMQLALDMDRINYETALAWFEQLPDEIKDTVEGRKLALALQKKSLVKTTGGGSGSRSSGGSSKSSGVSGMNKTAIKEYVNYNYKDENGQLNKYQLLKDLAFGGYSDEEANAVINAAGITQAEINAWQKDYVEFVYDKMFPYQNLPKSALDIPY